MQLFPVTDSKTGPQIIEILTKRVVAVGAVQSGSFIVDCETYSSVPTLGEPKHFELNVISFVTVFSSVSDC